MGEEEKYEKGRTRDRVRDTFKKEVYSQLSETSKGIDEIKKALLGDEYGNDGLVKQVKVNKEKIDVMDGERKVVLKVGKWAAGVIGSGGVLSWFTWDHIKELL